MGWARVFLSALPQGHRWCRECLKVAVPHSGIYTDWSLATNQACRNDVEKGLTTPTLSCRLAAAQPGITLLTSSCQAPHISRRPGHCRAKSEHVPDQGHATVASVTMNYTAFVYLAM